MAKNLQEEVLDPAESPSLAPSGRTRRGMRVDFPIALLFGIAGAIIALCGVLYENVEILKVASVWVCSTMLLSSLAWLRNNERKIRL